MGLNMKDLNLFFSERKERREGGIGLIIRNIYNATTIAQGDLCTTQFAKWKTRIDHTTLTMVRVYRPPSGSNLDILAEFTEWLTDNTVWTQT